MKQVFSFLSVALIALTGCNEKVQVSENINKDSLSVEIETHDNQSFVIGGNQEAKIVINENQEDMIDIVRLFSSEEFDAIRNNYVKQLRHRFWVNSLMEILSFHQSNECGDREKKGDKTAFSDNEKSENMDAMYRILLKKYPIFKPVSKELFEEKMKIIFGVEVNDDSLKGQSFYTNQSLWDQYLAHSLFNIHIDLKNHIVSFGDLPLFFKEEVNWDEFNKKLENIDQESLAYYDNKEKLYEEYLSEALQKKYTMYCSKIELEYLFHVNNYVFYENQASLSWLMANYEKTRYSFTSILFDFFNYDKEPRINKINMDYDISKGFPLYPNDYEHIFGEVESCSQIEYYNHFQFKVRTGLMQYVVDNCYDDTDLDDCGLKKDKYICVMEDCFDYLFKKVLEGDKYKESQNCHYYQTCAYLAYYLQKAYDNYVSHGDGQPRCWHNALVNNLYEDIRNNESRFENYVKESNYFDLEGFEEIMKDAHGQAMSE